MRRVITALTALLALCFLAGCGSTSAPRTAASAPASPPAAPTASASAASACSAQATTCGGPTSTPTVRTATDLLPASAASEIANVPAATANTIGQGSTTYPPTSFTSAALASDGKPKVLYVGAEWCPYCAAQRWVLAVALSRFGTFHHLGQVYSAADDGDLASLSFHGATYESSYLVFDANEIQDRNHNALDTLSATDAKIFDAYGQGYPFIDIAGKYQAGAMYDPETISGMTQTQIAADLKDPSSPVAQAIVGSANVLTTYLCKVTGGQPGNVCNAPAVTGVTAPS